PILNLFEKHLGSLKQLHTSQVKQAMKAVSTAFDEIMLLAELHALMNIFNGQKVPGNLLGVDGEVTMPKFYFIYEQYRLPPAKGNEFKSKRIVDILAGTQDALGTGPGTRWLVEVR